MDNIEGDEKDKTVVDAVRNHLLQEYGQYLLIEPPVSCPLNSRPKTAASKLGNSQQPDCQLPKKSQI